MSPPSPSIYTVAERAGVSIATVSRVLRGSAPVAASTRDRVLAAIDEVGWRPNHLARGLAGKGHSAVGIVFPDLHGSYFAQVILGYEDEAVAEDRSVLILATHGRANSDAMVLDMSDRVDGLVIMDRTVSDDVIVGLERAGTPVVLLARPPVGTTPSVRAENVATAAAITSHLLAHGHERVELAGDPDAAPDVEERWRGLLRAHAEAGVAAPDKPLRCGFLQDDGYALGLAVLDARRPPTALQCVNDEVALGVYGAARDLGLSIPGDLAVAGWDGIPAARAVTPALTTVRQPMRELGCRAGQLLSQRIHLGTTPASQTLPSEVVLRRSCGC